jgi:alpha-ketoglutarate-dependent taurine dioxygenase
MVSGSDHLAKTLLVRFPSLAEIRVIDPRLARVTCTVRDGRRAFVAQLLTHTKRRSYVRWDPGCMTPDRSEDQALIDSIIGRLASQCVAHSWTNDRVLIIDNWSVLHGRTKLSDAAHGRRALERVLAHEATQ